MEARIEKGHLTIICDSEEYKRLCELVDDVGLEWGDLQLSEEERTSYETGIVFWLEGVTVPRARGVYVLLKRPE